VLLAPQQAHAQCLGCLGFSTSFSGAGGGIIIDLTGRMLYATKDIKGKGSPCYHQEQVQHDGVASGLYAL
jgi:hypothetical protein